MQQLDADYEASPSEWVRRQVAEYEASEGQRANTMQGLPIVVVTMRGARSGKVRKVPLMRVEHGGTYVAVASQGGAPKHPQWYHNLVAHPEVRVQDGAQVVSARARIVTGDERAQWWERAVAAFPQYAQYQERTEREIPVFLLEPVSD
ncbi:deazaflavin-dependent oxidoreductase (nitroreductase family) [Georgenia soli]|uniref:Deazaflavin-dependent oxidoreductase (Nitroreductase family) n=1 Tax=Georgenia soli TaxID=638953 RepID=A0A2A9EPG1_9MICO|nr:nitroreductase family deazaflavin-dependent oxidoreductase [Georgenia soli]PFG40987.1 deazaflavin-dependent oxidoreductase (nitroreductase family) [Georgenia soli]